MNGFHNWSIFSSAYNNFGSGGDLPVTGLGLVIFILAAALFIMAGLFFHTIWKLHD